MQGLSLLEIRDKYSGSIVRFKLKDKPTIYHGKIMMLIYNTHNRKVKTPCCLDFDTMENSLEIEENKWSFKQLYVYEGQIQEIEFCKR